jgi:hypothetical protein
VRIDFSEKLKKVFDRRRVFKPATFSAGNVSNRLALLSNIQGSI